MVSGEEVNHGDGRKLAQVLWQRAMAQRKTRKSRGDIYLLKVTLAEVKPQIWRHLLVSADIRLGDLHQVLQVAMG